MRCKKWRRAALGAEVLGRLSMDNSSLKESLLFLATQGGNRDSLSLRKCLEEYFELRLFYSNFENRTLVSESRLSNSKL